MQICPIAELCHNSLCYHRTVHLRYETCESGGYREDGTCPECIHVSEVINEETFTKKEFEI